MERKIEEVKVREGEGDRVRGGRKKDRDSGR